MKPFVVVVFQIFFKRAIDFSHISRKLVDTFILKSPIKPFDMRIVVWFTDSRVAMELLHLRHEPISEFRSVIRLEHVKSKWRIHLRFSHKIQSNPAAHLFKASGVCPPRITGIRFKLVESLRIALESACFISRRV